MKKFFCALALTAVLLFGAASAEIITTDFVCYDFVRAILGTDEGVTMLIPPGTEVHTFEPSPAQVLSVGGADLFVCIGGESDVWCDSMLSSLGSDAPQVLKLMDGVELLEEEESDEHAHEETEMDEHIWTSPRNALKMLTHIEETLCTLNPGNAETLHANAAAYAAEISALDTRLTTLVSEAVRTKIVVADRFPFLYLVHDYGIDYVAAFASCTAQTEPSPSKMRALIDAVLSEKIPCIYIIEMSNGKVANAVAEETGATIETLHSMQTVTLDEFNNGETYVSIMEKNINALEKGLK